MRKDLKTMKRVISALLILCCVMSVSYAADTDDGVMPQYDNIAYIVIAFDINDWGSAQATCSVTLYPGYNVSGTLEIQQLKGNTWTSIDSSYDYGTGPAGVTISLQKYVSHGTYRAKITCNVTNSAGSVVEKVTEYSYIVNY